MLEQAGLSFTWLNPTRVIFGAGTLSELNAVIDETAGSDARVFLVTGPPQSQGKGDSPARDERHRLVSDRPIRQGAALPIARRGR